MARQTQADRRRVLVTGADGFIGDALCRSLREAGYDVWGLERSAEPADRMLSVDLQDQDATREALEAVRPAVVIHTAALAHGQKPPRGHTYSTYNLRLLESLLSALGRHEARLVFLSSVAVYGEDRRAGPVEVTAAQRPATDYARSKLLCEQRIIDSPLEHCDILRLAPVYDEQRLDDVRKRVFLPAPLAIKVRLRPPPRHSLCHLKTAVHRVLELLGSRPQGRTLQNVADAEPYDQGQLADWFPGRGVLLPVALLRPVYWLTYLLPRQRGYELRCLYSRMLYSNIYP